MWNKGSYQKLFISKSNHKKSSLPSKEILTFGNFSSKELSHRAFLFIKDLIKNLFFTFSPSCTLRNRSVQLNQQSSSAGRWICSAIHAEAMLSHDLGRKHKSTSYLFLPRRYYNTVFLNWPSPASFCIFSFFSNPNFAEKNCRLHRDSNSDCQSRRRAHWPPPPRPYYDTVLPPIEYSMASQVSHFNLFCTINSNEVFY